MRCAFLRMLSSEPKGSAFCAAEQTEEVRFDDLRCCVIRGPYYTVVSIRAFSSGTGHGENRAAQGVAILHVKARDWVMVNLARGSADQARSDVRHHRKDKHQSAARQIPVWLRRGAWDLGIDDLQGVLLIRIGDKPKPELHPPSVKPNIPAEQSVSRRELFY